MRDRQGAKLARPSHPPFRKPRLNPSLSVGASEPGLSSLTHGTQNSVWHPGCQTLTGRTQFRSSGQASSELISWSSSKRREAPPETVPLSDPALGSLRLLFPVTEKLRDTGGTLLPELHSVNFEGSIHETLIEPTPSSPTRSKTASERRRV